MDIVLRPATDDDLMAIGALHQRSRAAAYAHIDGVSGGDADALGAWWTERWRWERDTHRLTVADSGGEIDGFTYVGPSELEDTAELYAIHVDPALVGTGIGRRLMIDALSSLSAPRIVLWVLEENAVARAFYEKGGWSPDGTTRDESMGGPPIRQLRYTFVGGSTRPN